MTTASLPCPPAFPQQPRQPQQLRRLTHLACLLVLAAAACDGSGSGDAGVDGGYQPGVVPGTATLGESCATGADCKSELCLPVAFELSVCTELCDFNADTTVCPSGDSWTCAGHKEEPVVCRCQADSFIEVCADGRDNDCDGNTDDCRECGQRLVPPNDPNNCGDCGRRCVLGGACEDGVCACPDGSLGADCVAGAGDAECSADTHCDDGIDCTEDLCNAKGQCVHTVVPARCPAGQVCNLLQGGCQQGRACASAADCIDVEACTSHETCDPATRVCYWVPLDGDMDGQPPRVCGGSDCNDDQDQTYHGAVERCDGVDNDCDGAVDSPLPADACAPDRRCEGGSCQCTEGRLDCFGRCVDSARDLSHCGACGNACAPGALCQDGQCRCDDGETECAQGCFDLQSNIQHCGGCGISCAAPYEVCVAGSCVNFDECAAGTDTCGPHTRCVDIAFGYQCPCVAGYTLSSGVCVNIDECARGTDDCVVGGCTDTQGSYECACPAGYMGDGRVCQDVAECDVNDCGDHGTCVELVGSFTCDCDPGYAFDDVDTCVLSNLCQAGMLADKAWCAGYCADLLSDPAHCGDCDTPCAGSCVDGICQ